VEGSDRRLSGSKIENIFCQKQELQTGKLKFFRGRETPTLTVQSMMHRVRQADEKEKIIREDTKPPEEIPKLISVPLFVSVGNSKSWVIQPPATLPSSVAQLAEPSV
jgi:hypothetical protein